ncbi:WzxE family protein [Buttiauxella ferragutiae ATCC 51602]|uniref:WzxE family protein n=2 Tax=Buttiauxella ferragutiae TaxID=82989 RepID=A0ABX2W7S1_9ENTR|nr:WzxE family protein [Buttiauxella ferragutiae ATCC 51602]
MLGQLQSIIVSMAGLMNSAAGTGVVKFTAENHSMGIKACIFWWRASVYWIIILCSIFIPLLLIFSPMMADKLLFNREYYWLIQLSALLLPISAFGTLITSIINGQQLFRRYVILGIISVIISSVVMICMIVHNNLIGALLAASCQNGIIGLVMLIGSVKQPWFILSNFFGKVERVYKNDIGKFILMSATAALTTPVAMIIIRNILVENVGWVEAGYWQSVWKISEAYLAIITMALSTYYLPQLAKTKTLEEVQKNIIETLKLMLPTVIVLALIVYFLRDVIILILFTKEFNVIRDLFAVQLIGDVFKILGWIYAFPMIAKGAMKWYLSTEIIFSLIFVFLGWLFINKYGVHGANYAYLLNYILYSLVVFSNVKRFAK